MFKPRHIVLGFVFASAALFAANATAGDGVTAQPTPVSAPAGQDNKAAVGDAATKRLLLLMDTDQNGMVSKHEFMDYMEAEFERLDKNKDGELDVKELTQLHVRANPAMHK